MLTCVSVCHCIRHHWGLYHWGRLQLSTIGIDAYLCRMIHNWLFLFRMEIHLNSSGRKAWTISTAQALTYSFISCLRVLVEVSILVFLLAWCSSSPVGINLWSADTVILHDPDFNPHQVSYTVMSRNNSWQSIFQDLQVSWHQGVVEMSNNIIRFTLLGYISISSLWPGENLSSLQIDG